MFAKNAVNVNKCIFMSNSHWQFCFSTWASNLNQTDLLNTQPCHPNNAHFIYILAKIILTHPGRWTCFRFNSRLLSLSSTCVSGMPYEIVKPIAVSKKDATSDDISFIPNQQRWGELTKIKNTPEKSKWWLMMQCVHVSEKALETSDLSEQIFSRIT